MAVILLASAEEYGANASRIEDRSASVSFATDPAAGLRWDTVARNWSSCETLSLRAAGVSFFASDGPKNSAAVKSVVAMAFSLEESRGESEETEASRRSPEGADIRATLAL